MSESSFVTKKLSESESNSLTPRPDCRGKFAVLFSCLLWSAAQPVSEWQARLNLLKNLYRKKASHVIWSSLQSHDLLLVEQFLPAADNGRESQTCLVAHKNFLSTCSIRQRFNFAEKRSAYHVIAQERFRRAINQTLPSDDCSESDVVSPMPRRDICSIT